MKSEILASDISCRSLVSASVTMRKKLIHTSPVHTPTAGASIETLATLYLTYIV